MSLAAIACAMSLGLPGAALAGVATADGGGARFVDPGGAADRIAVTLNLVSESPSVDPQGWSVSLLPFGPPISPGPGCEEGFVGTICPFGANPPGTIDVDLGGGHDQLSFTVQPEAAAAPSQIAIAGGAGNDRIATVATRAQVDAGDGNDLILPDERWALAFPPGPTPGGAIRGGRGIDAVDYEQALDPIAVSLDGIANDGRPGERDNVRPDVENATGSDFGSTLIGSAVANALVGGGAADRIAGGAGRDRLEGRGGNDTLDALDAAGGDRIACDEGADVALADAGDVIAEGCEKLTWAPTFAGSRLRYRDARIAVALSCPKASPRCRGIVALRATSGKHATLAKASYRLTAGKRTSALLKPTRAGRSAFKRRSLKATAIVQPSGVEVHSGRTVSVRR